MDINSFILGLTTGKNAAAGDSGGGADGWLYAGGTFTPAAARHTVTHNFGKLPDIIFIIFNTTGIIEPNENEDDNSFGLTGFNLSESLFGGAVDGQILGNTVMYNPTGRMHMTGSYTGGIEHASGEWLIARVDSKEITFGGNIAKLAHHNNYGYTWAAYARK